jgi:hypothetical protein
VSATLRSLTFPWIVVVQDQASFGDLDTGHYEESSQSFRFGVDSTTPCGTAAQLALDITAAGGYTVTRVIDLTLETDEQFQSLQFFDDMEGVAPNGFTHYAEAGVDDWAYVTTDAYSATHSWFASDAGSVKNASLVSPPLFVTETSVLTFRHKYILEEGWDGAVLEISTDAGETWTDIGQSYNSQQEPLGAAFESPFLPGTPFWSGSSGGFVLETVNLGAMMSPLNEPLYAGSTVLIRWRIGCDSENSSPPHIGWWIDDISLTDSGTFTTLCDATAPCNLISDVPDGPPGPAVSRVEQNRPNPLRSSTMFAYSVGQGVERPVALRIFNIAGQVVRTLVDEVQESGSYEVSWDGTDDSGSRVPGGIYFYELKVGGERLVKKLTKVR